MDEASWRALPKELSAVVGCCSSLLMTVKGPSTAELMLLGNVSTPQILGTLISKFSVATVPVFNDVLTIKNTHIINGFT